MGFHQGNTKFHFMFQFRSAMQPEDVRYREFLQEEDISYEHLRLKTEGVFYNENIPLKAEKKKILLNRLLQEEIVQPPNHKAA